MAEAKNCPQCGLVNPTEAQRCDCGWDFVSGSAQQPYLAKGTTDLRQRRRMAKQRLDYLIGMLGGTAFGMAVAMIFVEPGWITPDNMRARGGVAVAGLAIAIVIENVFQWLQRKRDRDKRPND
jgi:hypothetical protein